MESQRGSVLVGVLGLALAMTLAAGGMLVLTTNSSGAEADTASDLQLHYAAETGMQLGIGWIRQMNHEKFLGAANWPDWKVEKTLTKDNLGAPGYAPIHGKLVKVTITNTLGEFFPHKVRVYAKDIQNPGELEVSRWVTGVNPVTPGAFKSIATVQEWIEIYHPDGI